MKAKILKNALILLWIGFVFLQLSGGKTQIAFQILMTMTLVLGVLLKWRPAASSINDGASVFLSVFKSTYIGLTFVAVCGALIFDFEALNGTMWDLTQYLQAVHYQATTGLPEFTFPMKGLNPPGSYLVLHRSLSLYLIASLYRFFGQCLWVPLIWQGICLVAPGIIFVLGYRAICKKCEVQASPIGELLVFQLWMSMPTVLAQVLWPYTFHIAGIVALSAGYYFFYKRNWLACFLSLVILAFEKEEFGIISAFFGVLILGELLWDLIKSKKFDLVGCLFGLMTLCVGLYSYSSFAKFSAKVIKFSDRFGHLGQTPFEAVKLIISRPIYVFENAFSNHNAQYSLWFFFLASFLWVFPRARIAKYLVPVLPIFFANMLASPGPMQLLKDHYALPVCVGICACLVYGVFVEKWTESSRQVAHRILFVVCLFPLYWGHQSVFRTFKESYVLWKQRSADRQAVQEVRKNKQALVCCEERLCSLFSDHPMLLEARFCVDGSSLLLKPPRGSIVYFVVYSKTNLGVSSEALSEPQVRRAPIPLTWTYQSDYLKLSAAQTLPVSN